MPTSIISVFWKRPKSHGIICQGDRKRNLFLTIMARKKNANISTEDAYIDVSLVPSDVVNKTTKISSSKASSSRSKPKQPPPKRDTHLNHITFICNVHVVKRIWRKACKSLNIARALSVIPSYLVRSKQEISSDLYNTLARLKSWIKFNYGTSLNLEFKSFEHICFTKVASPYDLLAFWVSILLGLGIDCGLLMSFDLQKAIPKIGIALPSNEVLIDYSIQPIDIFLSKNTGSLVFVLKKGI